MLTNSFLERLEPFCRRHQICLARFVTIGKSVKDSEPGVQTNLQTASSTFRQIIKHNLPFAYLGNGAKEQVMNGIRNGQRGHFAVEDFLLAFENLAMILEDCLPSCHFQSHDLKPVVLIIAADLIVSLGKVSTKKYTNRFLKGFLDF